VNIPYASSERVSTPLSKNLRPLPGARIGGKPLRVVVVSSFTKSLTNFRLELLKRLAERGYEVTAFGPEFDSAVSATLTKIGVEFVQIPMSRTGTGPISDLRTLAALVRHFRQIRPDVVLPYTMKPIIYGGIASRLTRVPRFYALFTGLGHVFADRKLRLHDIIVLRLSILLYRIALKHARRVFVYNDADEQDIRKHLMIRDLSRIVSVPGSGVDLAHYSQVQVPAGPPVYLLVARLLREKGIHEFVEASRQLRKRYPGIRCVLLGQFEPHNSGITRSDLDSWEAEGVVTYRGDVRDVRPYLAESTVFVLPSYYREGIPRSILEAMATGRPVITTDLPGCRDTVIDGHNGFLVPPRDAAALAGAMERFAVEPELAIRLGRQSRELARTKFDVHAVNRLLLGEMELI
jgi:glycosyltransferase involved in cell wall biosynthesis